MRADATSKDKSQSGASSDAPPQITTHPMLAVLGILLGALTSVFTSRLLSVGLSDVQGAIGASSDAMTWVSTSYNAATMFVGPLIVYLGGILGARRILLWASVVFIFSELLSPLVAHNIGALLILQFIAGMSAGTYYPLTLTIIVKNLAPRYLHLGLAAYALDILASTHAATALEAWYINNLSWHWIFWNALFTTPLLMACIFWGVPRQPMPPKNNSIDFSGFLFASVGLALVYCGLDQGERLDWFNSGLICAFFITGFLLLAVGFARRMVKPNPLVNLRFLATPNLLLLGAVLVLLRFLLLAPTLLVPQFLSALHGYRSDQTGQILGWISVVELIAAPLAGYLLYKIDSRLLCAFGFALAGLSCYSNSGLDPAWTGETFVVSQIVFAIGVAFALTGLVATIMRNAKALGALAKPANTLTLACWFQTCRLFGGEAGKTLLLRFLTVQGTFHYSILSQNFDGGFLTEERLRQLIGAVFPSGSGLDDAKLRASLTVAGELKQQITLLSIGDGFTLIALSAAFCLLLLGFVRYAPPLVPKEASS